MNIIFQYYKGSGGALINIKHLLEAVIHQNPKWNFVIVCSNDSVLNEITSPFSNVRFEHIKQFKLPAEINRLYYFIVQLKQIVDKYSADIIWSMNVGPYLNTSAYHVLSLNNAFQVCDENLLSIHPSGLFRVKMLRYFFKLSMKYTDLTILQTKFMEQMVKKSYPNTHTLVAKKSVGITTGSNFCDNKKINQVDKDNFNIVYIATDYSYKRHLLLLQTFNMFSNEIPNLKLILTLTYEQCFKIDPILTQELSDKNILICLGWVKPDELEMIYAKSKIAIMPSLIESLSSSHIEAMFWGVPQITSNLPYAKDLCKKAAFYIDDHASPEAWKNGLIYLYQNPNVRADLIQEGYNEAHNFPKNWDMAARIISQEFSNVCKDKY